MHPLLAQRHRGEDDEGHDQRRFREKLEYQVLDQVRIGDDDGGGGESPEEELGRVVGRCHYLCLLLSTLLPSQINNTRGAFL
jgi:hypothetical protein